MTVVMPLIAPLMKIQACKNHGAKVIMKGNNIGEVGKDNYERRKLSIELAVSHNHGNFWALNLFLSLTTIVISLLC